jgi:homoserine kinase
MIRAVAPASTANLGPGFDCAAAALDLWNELEVEEGPHDVVIEGEGADELSRGADQLALRAFAVYADPSRYRFRFLNRVPLERGLGSSAAAVSLGLVAGAAAAGREPSREELLDEAVRLEGHADNVAAALYGGVCLAWSSNGVSLNGGTSGFRAARIAQGMPLRPVLAVPSARTSTVGSRTRLPAEVSHGDAVKSSAAAALLGAAIASGDAELLLAAFHDRLHEPYRAADAPLLAQLGDLPVTLSGSGPSVVVWAAEDRADDLAGELRRRLPPDTTVLPLRVAQEGARLA